MRIAIVNDTVIAVEALRRVLRTVPDYKIAWIAGNGAEAIAKCANDIPDLILMDLSMPIMDGVEATYRIMANSPCAILIVTATFERNAPQVFEAMGYGALDVVITPILGIDGSTKGGENLLAKIVTIRKLIGKSTGKSSPRVSRLSGISSAKKQPPLVVIGASTGGPQAIAKILSRLSKNLGAAIVIVQHVDVQFAPGLADWLNAQTPLSVGVAIAGCQPEVGKVWIAGTNDHMILRSNLTLTYIQEPLDYAYRPSVNVFFKSVAQHWQGTGVGILLTGMGRDGAQGLKVLRSEGWHTIAQDKTTSVVYGMPRAAAELNAAVEVLAIDAIAPALMKVLQLEASG